VATMPVGNPSSALCLCCFTQSHSPLDTLLPPVASNFYFAMMWLFLQGCKGRQASNSVASCVLCSEPSEGTMGPCTVRNPAKDVGTHA